MLPTAMPRVPAPSRRRGVSAAVVAGLSFTTARPVACKVLHVWQRGGGARRHEVGAERRRLACSAGYEAAAAMRPRSAVQTLEEDVLFAYRKALAMSQEEEAGGNTNSTQHDREEGEAEEEAVAGARARSSNATASGGWHESYWHAGDHHHGPSRLPFPSASASASAGTAVVAPGCALQGSVFTDGFYFPHVIPGATTPQLVP